MKQLPRKWNKKYIVFFISCILLMGFVNSGNNVKATEIVVANQDTEAASKAQVGEAIYFKERMVTMTPASTKKLKLKGATSKIKWTSSNNKIATVNNAGKVTAKKKGTAKIKAKHNGIEYICIVNVLHGSYKLSDGMKYKDVSGNFGKSGRWYKKSIDGGRYYFTGTEGSAIYFKVTGTKYVDINFVSNTIVATPYFSYSVDGGKMKRQTIKKKRISVGNKKTHYVRLVIDAMSESENRWEGEAGVGIKNIKPTTKTGVVTAIKPKNKTIAFYGDSITQGVRVLNMALTPSGTSATHSYAWHCAKKLKMVPYYAGFGGSGIIEPGGFNNCHNTISNFSAGRKAKSFDADIIVVEHGTNDVNYFGEIYIKEYKNVLSLLHKAHPKAQIMAMIPFSQIHADEIRKAVEPYKSWCTVVETASWNIFYTDGLHPNETGARTIANNLAKKIQESGKAL